MYIYASPNLMDFVPPAPVHFMPKFLIQFHQKMSWLSTILKHFYFYFILFYFFISLGRLYITIFFSPYDTISS